MDIAQSILKDENIPITEKQKGIKEMRAIDKKLMRLKESLFRTKERREGGQSKKRSS